MILNYLPDDHWELKGFYKERLKDLAHSSWDNCHNTEHGMNLIEMKSNTIKKTRDGSNYASIDLSDVDESDEAI